MYVIMMIIGALSIDLRNVQSPSRKLPYTSKFMPLPKWRLNLFRINNVRGWWPFLGPSRTKMETVVNMMLMYGLSKNVSSQYIYLFDTCK